MKRQFCISICLLLLAIPGVRAEEVRVAVAANFLATLQAIAPLYEQQSGDRLIISGASTGKLYAQIVNGAPYDVLLAADEGYPEKLERAGRVVGGSRFVYARGRLALWRAQPAPIDQGSLAAPAIRRIAIANPRTAPYGLAAKQVLESLGLWDSLQDKLVQGESTGQAFQFIASGNAQLGFVALSQVLNPANRFNRQHYWLVSETAHQPLQQGAALLDSGRDKRAARRFLEFLQGEAARQVMERYGYAQ